MKTFGLAVQGGIALQLSLWIGLFIVVEAQDRCYYSRLDVLPCPTRPRAPPPESNQYSIYQTRIGFGRSGLIQCRIRSRNIQVRNISTFDNGMLKILQSPGYPQSYPSQILVNYSVQCPEGHLPFINFTRMDIQPRACPGPGGLTVCSDYLLIDQGPYGAMEFCGNETEFRLEMLTGEFTALFRTDEYELDTFSGFEMYVICYRPDERDLPGCRNDMDINSLLQLVALAHSTNATFNGAAVGALICSENACNPVLKASIRVALWIYSRINTTQVEEIRELLSADRSCERALTIVVVGFERHTYTVGEEDRQVELCVNLTVPSRQDIGTATFNLTVETQDGSAGSIAPSEDYTGVSMTLNTFTIQQPRQCFYVLINNDAFMESNETFTTRLTLIPASATIISPDRIIVDPPQTTVQITDNDLRIVVGYVTNVTVLESDGVATLTVAISMPPEEVQIPLSFYLLVNTMDGSATAAAPTDYGALRLGPFNNDTRQLSFSVSIANDNIPEDSEMFRVSLTLDPCGQAQLGNHVTVLPDVATVTIQDSDEITVGYTVTDVTVLENGGVAQLTVAITIPTGEDQIETSFSLLVNTLNGTGTAPGDYSGLTNFSLGPFNSGVRQLSFNVFIANDNITEDVETFRASLTLDPADQVRLGNRVTVSPDVATVMIQDNEVPLLTTTTMYTNEGNEFFVGFMENPPLFPSASDDSFFISTNQSETVVPVNVTIRGGMTRVVQADPAVTNTLSIPSNETRMPPQGIHILAPNSNELTVFGSNEEFISVDGFLALPCPQLPVQQYNYYAISVPPTISGVPLIMSGSAILIISCNNDTQVTFIPTQSITDPQNSDCIISAGTNTTVTLAAAQPLYIQGRSDLTGTHIVSNQPISFFSGHECAYRPPTQGAQCDHIVEQIPPTVTWGRIFLTAPSADRITGDIFKILAPQENTTVNVTCVNRAAPLDIPLMPNYTVTLEAAGNSWNFTASASDYCSIEADKPILVAQIGIGDANLAVDTYMTLVPAVSQYRNNIRFSVVGNPRLQHWTNMFVIPAYFEPANITVEGVQASPEDWVTIRCSNGGVCGYGRQIKLGGSRLKLVRHNNPEASLGVIVYGSTPSEAYGYPGGLKLSVNNSIVT